MAAEHEWTLGALPDYWARLTGCVHPDDEPTFNVETSHGFNLDFPPPAFVGDVVNAPVLILDNNGGYRADLTPGEFRHPQAAGDMRERLKSPRSFDPRACGASPYYSGRNFSTWLSDGRAALVNAVAYRSVDGAAPQVARLARSLPSARYHREWLKHAVFPLVRLGQRFVVVHRWGRWGKAVNPLRGSQFAIFSRAPIGADLTALEMEAAQLFLNRS